MKSLYLRAGLALVCALTLASCGGNNGNMALTGIVTGLTKPGLVLVNKSNGESITVDGTATSVGNITFQFTKLLATDEQFDVEVQPGTPIGAVCKATSNNSKANVYTVNQTVITCVTNPYHLGGTVTGLDGTGLVLANGPDTVSVPAPTTAGAPVNFTFNGTVGDGEPYGVTVLAQPQGTSKKCTVTSGTGLMGSSDLKTVVVTCI